jgi:hypothetical protein
VARYARNGLFSWVRIGMALIYYATGLKLERAFPVLFDDLYGGIEGPRAVIPLCAPLLFGLASIGLVSLLRRPGAHATPWLLTIGLASGFMLVLGYQALCLRYVFDGWGLLLVLAALGLRVIIQSPQWTRRVTNGALALLVVGFLGSHLTLLRYKIVYSGTDPVVRYEVSKALQPLICPAAPLNPNVKLTDFNPLVTLNCPPVW